MERMRRGARRIEEGGVSGRVTVGNHLPSGGKIRSMPNRVPFLEKLLATIDAIEVHDELFNRVVNELTRVLASEADIEALAHANQHFRHKDPLSYFHEQFLEQNNPQLRGLRGVYYTPDPVVSYMVRSVDFVLRSHFNLQNGLAETSEDMLLLDPACGTGIFLQAVVDHVRNEFQKTSNPMCWQDYVHLYLLPNLFGFELLPVPYVIAHLKLAIQLAALDVPEPERQSWAYHFQHNEQPNIYLTNTLEEVKETLIRQGQERTAYQILVVLGNPPFAGHSSNKGEWITTSIDTYKEGCPELKKPGQAKWLSDDYVKFMRFAQWHIEQVGYGILAFITNHSYVDNPTFRGMRHSLLKSFDDIYILDLHGNRKKHEQAPDGSKDENVFDIQQGVAIGIFVKWRDSESLATVHHADLWGLREVYRLDAFGRATLSDGKYLWLADHNLASTQWTGFKPQAPFYFFSPQEIRYLEEYSAGWSVADIFRPNGDPAPGVVTCHDQFAISWTKKEACAKIERFLSTETEKEARQLFRLCSQNQWQYHFAKSQLEQNLWHQDITEILYRPFDRRWTIFNCSVAVHRRERVMRHMLDGTNIGLAVGRAGHVIDQDEWDIAFCTRYITDFNLFRRGGNNLFPLYLYDHTATRTSKVNLAANFIVDFATRLGIKWIPFGHGDLEYTFGPEDIFTYIYALFYSPTYRKRYAPFLKFDFPRVPLTSNAALFRALYSYGDRLVNIHLMEQPMLPISAFPIAGTNDVVEVSYKKGQVWINATQYFNHVPWEAWNFSIGGYQICRKWLKDRKGRVLSGAEIAHYQHIVAILAETSNVMHEIDAVIENYGGWPI
jgi:predicted helicase